MCVCVVQARSVKAWRQAAAVVGVNTKLMTPASAARAASRSMAEVDRANEAAAAARIAACAAGKVSLAVTSRARAAVADTLAMASAEARLAAMRAGKASAAAEEAAAAASVAVDAALQSTVPVAELSRTADEVTTQSSHNAFSLCACMHSMHWLRDVHCVRVPQASKSITYPVHICTPLMCIVCVCHRRASASASIASRLWACRTLIRALGEALLIRTWSVYGRHGTWYMVHGTWSVMVGTRISSRI